MALISSESFMRPSVAPTSNGIAHPPMTGVSQSRVYSGVKDLPSQLPFDDAFPNALICGHTHRRVIGEVVPGFHCVNVGSDYGMLMYYLLEL